MKYFYTLLFLSLFLACNSKKADKVEQIRVEDHITTTDVTAPENRKLRFLSLYDTKWIGYYDDGTICKLRTDKFTKEDFETLSEQEVSGTYLINSKTGQLEVYDQTKSLVEEISFGDNNGWLMIDYQWHYVPECLKDANIVALEKDFGLSEVGVEVLLYEVILDDDEEISSAIDWYQLSYLPEEKHFITEKVNLKRDTFYWDCGEIDIPFVKSDSKHNGLILFRGVRRVDDGVNFHPNTVSTVRPGQKYSFSFEGQKYSLRAEGIPESIANKDNELEEEGYKDYANYKLYLSSGDKEQLLMYMPNFNETFIEIQFVGDLDGDGKPDFIFETSNQYEYNESTLYLSSFAKDGELVKCVGQSGYGLFC